MKNSDINAHASVIQDVRDNIITVNEETLERIKAKFSHVINSARSMFYVRTLKDLVNILELRAIDGRDREEFSSSLVEFANSPKAEKFCAKPDKAQDIPRHVLETIANGIGRKWWDMARYLDIPEPTIEEIEGKYHFSVKQQAYQALLTFSKEHDGEGKEKKLLDALVNSRRYDLMSKVEKELSKKDGTSKK